MSHWQFSRKWSNLMHTAFITAVKEVRRFFSWKLADTIRIAVWIALLFWTVLTIFSACWLTKTVLCDCKQNSNDQSENLVYLDYHVQQGTWSMENLRRFATFSAGFVQKYWGASLSFKSEIVTWSDLRNHSLAAQYGQLLRILISTYIFRIVLRRLPPGCCILLLDEAV